MTTHRFVVASAPRSRTLRCARSVLGSAFRWVALAAPRQLQGFRCLTSRRRPRPRRRVVLPVDPTRRTEIDKQRVPMSARPYRLLALVKQDAVVRVQKEPDDTVMTWPHLLTIEFLAAGIMSIFLLLMGLFINAPLEELANGNVTPAVAKAPWYFLGLQELLAYFHPTVAGVLVPGFVLVGAALIPYIDRENILAVRPSRAQDRGHAVHDVLHPGADRDVRRHLLPRPGLHVRDPVRDQPRPPFRPVMTSRRIPAHEQLPRRADRQARRPDQGGDQVAAQAAGPGPVAAPADARRARDRASGCGCSR